MTSQTSNSQHSHFPPPWDGSERRRQDQELAEIYNLLRDIKIDLEVHLEEEKQLRPKLQELISVLERSKGVVTFIKVVLYIGTPITAFVVWAKDHVKL